MGYASTFENIEERRLEAEFQRSFDDLINWVRTHSLDEVWQKRRNLENASQRMVEYIEDRRREAFKVFQEALKIFRDPHVRVMNRLAKREKELKEVREKLNVLEADLKKFRERRDVQNLKFRRLLKENAELREKNAELIEKNHRLLDKLAWYTERDKVRPLHTR